MNKLNIFSLFLFLIVVAGCVKKQVYFPIPVTFEESVFIANYSSGTFNEAVLFNSTKLKDTIQERISEYENSSINNVLVESLTYTLIEADDPNTVLNGNLKVAYGPMGPYQLLNIKDLNLSEMIQKTITVDLEESGVDLIAEALRDIVFDNETDDLIFGINGSIDTIQNNSSFKLKIDLTVNTIVTQCQEIFDPLGSDNENCN